MVSRLSIEGHFKKFIELARKHIPPAECSVRQAQSTSQFGPTFTQSLSPFAGRLDNIDRNLEAINYKLDMIFGASKNNTVDDFELMMFHRASAIFANEKLEFKPRLEQERTTQRGGIKIPIAILNVLGVEPPRIIETPLFFRESTIDNLTRNRSHLLDFNLAKNYDEIRGHIWARWIDEKHEKKLRERAKEGDIELVIGEDLFFINGKSIFENNK